MMQQHTDSYTTSRLNVVELAGQSDLVHELALFDQIPKLLSAEVTKSLPPYFQNIDNSMDAKLWFERMTSQSQLFVVMPIEQNVAIGFVFMFIENDVDAHIGYLLKQDFWGKGLASELIQGVIEYAQSNQNWQRLIAGVELDNHASLRLLEKVGFIKQHPPESGSMFYHYQLSNTDC